MKTFPRTLIAWLALTTIASAAKPPNIVYYFIDDLGWTDVSFMGSKYYETPHVDRLAREGMKFMSAYSNAPNCAPSRACLMSGQYGPRHGVFTVANSDRGKAAFRKLIPIKNKTVLADKFVTIAESLKAAGYVTATMGKWHLGEDPTTQGFDVNIAGKQWGGPAGGGYHSPYNYPNLVNRKKGEYLTDRLGTEACKFIEANKEKPFFLYLTHYAVHTPIQGKADLTAKYKKKKPVGGHNNPAYAAMVESMDDSIGAVQATLKRLKLDDNTIVIFFADNGGHAGVTSNAPLRGSKGMLYEGGIREPLAIKWPGVTKPGSTCHKPVIAGRGQAAQELFARWRQPHAVVARCLRVARARCVALAFSVLPPRLLVATRPLPHHACGSNPNGRLETHRVFRGRQIGVVQFEKRPQREKRPRQKDARENQGASHRNVEMAQGNQRASAH